MLNFRTSDNFPANGIIRPPRRGRRAGMDENLGSIGTDLTERGQAKGQNVDRR